MTSIFKKTDLLTSILRETYRLRETANNGDAGCAHTMERIRRIGPLPTGNDMKMWFEHVVWRLSPAVLALILITAFFVTRLDVWSAHEVFSLFENTEEITLAQLFIQ